MRFYPGDSDRQPIRYVGRVPVFATTILAAFYCAGLLATAMLLAAHRSILPYGFSADDFFRRGWLWQILTWSFVNIPDINFIFSIFVFYQAGKELELYFGRRTFLKFYGLLILTVVLVAGGGRLFGQMDEFTGLFMVTCGFFVGYATLYPGLEWFGLIALKYVAAAFMIIFALRYLAANAWLHLAVLAGICAVGYSFVNHAKRGGSVEFGGLFRKFKIFRQQRKFRVIPSSGGSAPKAGPGFGSAASVDHILDKIAQQGFASLTQDERDQLERARDILNKKRQ